MSRGTLQQLEQKPMGVGTIITVAWRHYRDCFSLYLPLALRGTAWLLLPTVGLLFALLYILQKNFVLSDFSGMTALFVPAWLVLFLWCVAQSLGEFAGISRFVYQSLSSPEGASPEPIDIALRFTRSRKFSLLGSAAVKGIILGTINLVFSFLLVAAVVMVFVGLGVLPGSSPSLGLFFGGGGVAIVAAVVFIWLYTWLALRLLVNEQSLAIETHSGAILSIGHSWKLMRQNLMRSLWVVVLAFFITIPVTLSMTLLAQVGHPFLFKQLGIALTERTVASMGLLPYLTAYLVSSILSLVGGIIVKPFFRTVLTTLYFDIKNRKQSIEA